MAAALRHGHPLQDVAVPTRGSRALGLLPAAEVVQRRFRQRKRVAAERLRSEPQCACAITVRGAFSSLVPNSSVVLPSVLESRSTQRMAAIGARAVDVRMLREQLARG